MSQHVTTEAIETLLFRTESETLDFKEAQYRVVGGSPEERSEFVKDVLAFANAWKSADAHIVLGVRENPGGRATVVGGISHIDDATLQQLVNTKTNRPVRFEYVPAIVDGQQIAIIRIARDQERPLYLPKKFGKLAANAVYVRRGSSTAVAGPDEIARMGAASAATSSEPMLVARLRHAADSVATSDTAVTVVSTLLDARPAPAGDALVDILPPALRELRELRARLVVESPFGRPPSTEAIEEFLRARALLGGLVVEVENAGHVLARDIRVQLTFPCTPGLDVRDEAPRRPVGGLGSFARLPSATSVSAAGGEWSIMLRIGKIQPGTVASSDPFWIGSASPGEVPVAACVFGDNVPRVLESDLTITFEVRHQYLDEAAKAFEKPNDH